MAGKMGVAMIPAFIVEAENDKSNTKTEEV